MSSKDQSLARFSEKPLKLSLRITAVPVSSRTPPFNFEHTHAQKNEFPIIVCRVGRCVIVIKEYLTGRTNEFFGMINIIEFKKLF